MKRLATLSLGLSLLAACGNNNLDLPTGEQEVTGLLREAELALDRRGSHVLTEPDTDEELFFVESPTVNLGEFVDRYVTLRGVYEANITSDDLPVFVVDTVVDVENSAGQTVKLTELGVSFVMPVSWGSSQTEDGMALYANPTQPATIIIYEAVVEDIAELDEPASIIVSGKPAYRVNQSNNQLVYIKYNTNEGEYLVFAFSPQPDSEVDVRAQWLEVLSSVEIENEAPPESPVYTGSGTAMPCGGTANIICQQGQFCKITDPEYQVGVCVNLAS